MTTTNDEKLEEGDYGYAVVLRGAKKGQIVYYDDDDESGKAIVYPGAMAGGYFLVKLSSLRKATPLEARRHEKEGKGIGSAYGKST